MSCMVRCCRVHVRVRVLSQPQAREGATTAPGWAAATRRAGRLREHGDGVSTARSQSTLAQHNCKARSQSTVRECGWAVGAPGERARCPSPPQTKMGCSERPPSTPPMPMGVVGASAGFEPQKRKPGIANPGSRAREGEPDRADAPLAGSGVRAGAALGATRVGGVKPNPPIGHPGSAREERRRGRRETGAAAGGKTGPRGRRHCVGCPRRRAPLQC